MQNALELYEKKKVQDAEFPVEMQTATIWNKGEYFYRSE